MDRTTSAAEADVVVFLSIVVPVRNEAENIGPLLQQLVRDVKTPSEVLFVYDADDDPTISAVRAKAIALPFEVRLIRNELGSGPANALLSGFRKARGDAIVVVMADLSDDLRVVDRMVLQIAARADLVSGSRYMPGGNQFGGPLLKGFLSRLAGLSLYYLTEIPTRDATNSFKMYRTDLLRSLEIEGATGFEISMQITVKAWLAGWHIVELPTTWTDRITGESKFRLWKWLPRYLRWYLFALKARRCSKRPT